jgi:hypothetical protein
VEEECECTYLFATVSSIWLETRVSLIWLAEKWRKSVSVLICSPLFHLFASKKYIVWSQLYEKHLQQFYNLPEPLCEISMYEEWESISMTQESVKFVCSQATFRGTNWIYPVQMWPSNADFTFAGDMIPHISIFMCSLYSCWRKEEEKNTLPYADPAGHQPTL